jgi:hypothetical protein
MNVKQTVGKEKPIKEKPCKVKTEKPEAMDKGEVAAMLGNLKLVSATPDQSNVGTLPEPCSS